MNIGIDIDDTTVDLMKYAEKYGEIYNEKILGRKKREKEWGEISTRFYLKELFGWNEENRMDFFKRYYKNIIEECTLLPNAQTVINKLKKAGNGIYFISARFLELSGCNTKEITENTLKSANIEYDELILGIGEKLKVCKEKNIDIFIDDSYDTCLKLQENGIKTYLMTTKMNEKIDTKEVVRVKDWNDILNKIKEIC